MSFLEFGGQRHALPLGESVIGSDASAVVTLEGDGEPRKWTDGGPHHQKTVEPPSDENGRSDVEECVPVLLRRHRHESDEGHDEAQYRVQPEQKRPSR